MLSCPCLTALPDPAQVLLRERHIPLVPRVYVEWLTFWTPRLHDPPWQQWGLDCDISWYVNVGLKLANHWKSHNSQWRLWHDGHLGCWGARAREWRTDLPNPVGVQGSGLKSSLWFFLVVGIFQNHSGNIILAWHICVHALIFKFGFFLK